MGSPSSFCVVEVQSPAFGSPAFGGAGQKKPPDDSSVAKTKAERATFIFDDSFSDHTAAATIPNNHLDTKDSTIPSWRRNLELVSSWLWIALFLCIGAGVLTAAVLVGLKATGRLGHAPDGSSGESGNAVGWPVISNYNASEVARMRDRKLQDSMLLKYLVC